MLDREKLIAQAAKWIGYMEKKSDLQLKSFTANVGDKNYTIFADEYCKYFNENVKVYQGQPWCAMFVSVIFANAFGAEKAEKMLCGHYAYCPYGVEHFKKKGRWKTANPKAGDVIFFKNSKGTATHTGIVVKVDGERVYTIEGNTSTLQGVVPNGGEVARKSYDLTYKNILGYGDIVYSGDDEMTDAEKARMQAIDDSLTNLYNIVEKQKTNIDILKYALETLQENNIVYNTIDELPDYARPVVQRLIGKGVLKGDENGNLKLSENAVKVFVINDRMGLYA